MTKHVPLSSVQGPLWTQTDAAVSTTTAFTSSQGRLGIMESSTPDPTLSPIVTVIKGEPLRIHIATILHRVWIMSICHQHQ